MITRIEIDGFKSFHNFALDLKPFQVLVGPNGAGKSNLFEAIVLVSLLAHGDTLDIALQTDRGKFSEFFSLMLDGNRSHQIYFGVEMLIGRTIKDDLGGEAEVSATRVRYELKIERRFEDERDQFYVTHERLAPIAGDRDVWVSANIPEVYRSHWVIPVKRNHELPFIGTEKDVIVKHPDNVPTTSTMMFMSPTGFVSRAQRTVLSTITDVQYATAYAVKREMDEWSQIQFDPAVLRLGSWVYRSGRVLESNGANIAAVLRQMSREDEYVLKDVAIDMANIVPGILSIDVQLLPEREIIRIEVETTDHARFPSNLLSDGTLRLLAFAVLRNNPNQRGVFCIEEPENGVSVQTIKRITELLKNLATNFDEPPDEDSELNQVLVSTHSPLVLSHIEVSDILFVYMTTRATRETRITPITDAAIASEDPQRLVFTLDQLKRYLETGALEEQRENLEALKERL